MASLTAHMKRFILVVDDDQQIRELLRLILERIHYDVRLASDSAMAMEWLEAHQEAVDLVLINASMPVMLGYEASHRIKQICPETPIILMSGYSRQHFDGIDGALCDIDGFLKKPFKIVELYEEIERCGCFAQH